MVAAMTILQRKPATYGPRPRLVYVGEPGASEWTPSKKQGKGLRPSLHGMLKKVKPPKNKPQKPKRKAAKQKVGE